MAEQSSKAGSTDKTVKGESGTDSPASPKATEGQDSSRPSGDSGDNNNTSEGSNNNGSNGSSTDDENTKGTRKTGEQSPTTDNASPSPTTDANPNPNTDGNTDSNSNTNENTTPIVAPITSNDEPSTTSEPSSTSTSPPTTDRPSPSPTPLPSPSSSSTTSSHTSSSSSSASRSSSTSSLASTQSSDVSLVTATSVAGKTVTAVVVPGDLGQASQAGTTTTNKLSDGAIAGISVGAAVFALIVAAVLTRICLRRRRRNRLEEKAVAGAMGGASPGLEDDMDFCDKAPFNVANSSMLPTQPHWGGYLETDGRSTPAGMAGRGAGVPEDHELAGPVHEYDYNGYAMAANPPPPQPKHNVYPSADLLHPGTGGKKMLSTDRLTITPPPHERHLIRNSFGVFGPTSDTRLSLSPAAAAAVPYDTRLSVSTAAVPYDTRLSVSPAVVPYDTRLSVSHAADTGLKPIDSRRSNRYSNDPRECMTGFRTPYSVRTADTSPSSSMVELPPLPQFPASALAALAMQRAAEQEHSYNGSPIFDHSKDSLLASTLTLASTADSKNVVTPNSVTSHVDRLPSVDMLAVPEKAEMATRIADLPPAQLYTDWRKERGLPPFCASPATSSSDLAANFESQRDNRI